MVLLGITTGCAERAEEEDNVIVLQQPESTLSYSFATAEISDVSKTAKMKCSYVQVNGQEVSFSLEGKQIETVYVKEGDTVQKGQLLCELSVENLEKQIEVLEYQIARNELLMKYTDEDLEVAISGYWIDYLYNSNRTEKDKEKLDSKIQSARQSYRYKAEDYSDTLSLEREEMEKLKEELAASRLYAGTDGVVYKLKKNLEGTLSEEGVVLMTIMDTTETLFEAKNKEYAQYFKEGDVIPMTMKSGNTQTEYELTPWHISEWEDTLIFKVINTQAGAINVGASGNINMTVEERTNVLNIPSKAVKKADEKTYVYVLGADNIREIRWVETGFYGDDRVEILSGLSEGEKVILK